MKKNQNLREDANVIIKESLEHVLPDEAVKNVLGSLQLNGQEVLIVAVGKAAWQMAKTASETLNKRENRGIIITKYNHSKGDIPGMRIFEAGHPVPDENTFFATEEVLKMVSNLSKEQIILFLLSGGGSALFEKPLIPKEELEDITNQLLACGADIREINTIRKRISGVKGGKFALSCQPAKVISIILSDIIGDPLDMIASGPAYPDSSTCDDAMEIVKKYELKISEQVQELLMKETPKELSNVETHVIGSVRHLCNAAMESCRRLGYRPVLLTTSMDCTAKDAGSFLASIAREYRDTKESLAYISGGETVVQITGNGKGGRNQEIALSAAVGISGLPDTAVFSFGSDGTDGPTDAAGGFVDGDTAEILRGKKIKICDVLKKNDSYHALEKCGGLIITGATGTNVNDVSVVLIKR